MMLTGYSLILWRRRRFVTALWFVLVLTTGVGTWLWPKSYTASATVLTPKESGSGWLSELAVSGLLPQMPMSWVPSLTPTRDLLVGLLKSRTIATAVVEEFKLRNRYRVKFLEDAVKKLESSRSILASKDGIVSVKVEDRDPEVAAAMANFHVEQLTQLVTKLGISQAGRHRVFIAEQLARAKRDLAESEESLRQFQEKNRAIVLQEQTKGTLETAARLKGEILASEVQLEVVRNFATDNNPEVVALRRRLDEQRHQLAEMQYGDDGANPSRTSARREIRVPFAKIPEVGLELARRTRDVKVQETLVTLLISQFEQAKIAEAKDVPLVQVVDRAIPPQRHSSPKLLPNLVIAGVLGLLIAVSLALFLEHYLPAPRSREATSSPM